MTRKTKVATNSKEALAELFGLPVDQLTADEIATCDLRTEAEIHAAEIDAMKAKPGAINDFYAYLPEHKYLNIVTGDLWPSESVNSIRRGMSRALDKSRAVQQQTWCPGQPMIIKNSVVLEAGFTTHEGYNVFNRYKPADFEQVENPDARRWHELLEFLYPDDADHIEKYFAFKVQHPGEKINHG